MSENKAILAKLHKIMLDVPYLQKDAANPHHKYNYASEKAIKEAVGKALRDNGVVFSLNVSNIMREGGKTDITCDYGFHDVDTGECFSGHFLGCGPDRDDKGLYIAITGAIKYILTTTLLIATGDDPEVVREDSDEQPASKYPDYEKKADLVHMVLALENEVFKTTAIRGVARKGQLDGKEPTDKGVTQPQLLEYRDSLLLQLIIQREEEVYENQTAWYNGRKKYLGQTDLYKPVIPTDKLMAYSKHMKERGKE